MPAGSLLAPHAASGAYTDGYAVTLAQDVTLAAFMAAFYTTPLFKLERWLLARVFGFPSSDAEAVELAEGRRTRFAAWQIEARQPGQVVLAAGRTRSWLMVAPEGSATTLFFGSAVLPRRAGGMGGLFIALLGFHRLYSRLLLAAAARRLEQVAR